MFLLRLIHSVLWLPVNSVQTRHNRVASLIVLCRHPNVGENFRHSSVHRLPATYRHAAPYSRSIPTVPSIQLLYASCSPLSNNNDKNLMCDHVHAHPHRAVLRLAWHGHRVITHQVASSGLILRLTIHAISATLPLTQIFLQRHQTICKPTKYPSYRFCTPSKPETHTGDPARLSGFLSRCAGKIGRLIKFARPFDPCIRCKLAGEFVPETHTGQRI